MNHRNKNNLIFGIFPHSLEMMFQHVQAIYAHHYEDRLQQKL